ncbi:MAG: hypothetical protein AAGG48_10665 [Planctomycetota bacterium]
MKQLIRVSFALLFVLATEHASGGIICGNVHMTPFDWTMSQLPLAFEDVYSFRDSGTENRVYSRVHYLDEAVNRSLSELEARNARALRTLGASAFVLESDAWFLDDSEDLLLTILASKEKQRFDPLHSFIPYDSFFPWDAADFSGWSDGVSRAATRGRLLEPFGHDTSERLMLPYMR